MSDEQKPKRGGKRPGAGRKKTGRCSDSPHRTRPALSPKHPVHVTLRVKKGVPKLRTGKAYAAVRRALVRCLGKDEFRVVHVSIQRNHVHFLVEAADERALSRGMKSLATSAARKINRAHGRRGKLFEHRYHAKHITTSMYARNALAYVLNNWRRHREDFVGNRQRAAMVDPYSSGVSFDGWKGSPRFAVPTCYAPLPVSPPRTDLLRSAWQWYGAIDCYELPGPLEVAVRW